MSLVTDSNSCPCPLPANIVYVNPTRGGCTNKNIFRTIKKAVSYTNTHIPLMQTVIITLYPGTYILDETIRIVRPRLVIQAFTAGTVTIQGSFLVSDELYPLGISSRVQFDGLCFNDPSSGIACDMIAANDAERSIILSNTTFTTTTIPFEGSVVNLTTGDAAGMRTQLLLKNVVITEDISADDPTVYAPLIITQPATSDADYATGSLSIVGSLITTNSVRPLISTFAPYKLTVTDSKAVSQIERQEAEDTYVISVRFLRPNRIPSCTISVSNTTISSRSTSGLLVQHEFESTDTPTVNLMDSMFDVSYFYPIRAIGRFNTVRLQRIMAFGIAPKTSVSVVAVPPAPPSDFFPVIVFNTKILDCNLSDGGSAIEVLDGVGLTGRRLVLKASQENGIKARTTILQLDQATINSAGSCIFLDGSLLNQSTNCTLTSLGSTSAAVDLTRKSYAELRGGTLTAPRAFRFAPEYVQTGFNALDLVQLSVSRALIESAALQDVAVTIQGCTSSGFRNFGVNTQPAALLNLKVNLDNSLIANLNTQGNVRLI